MTKVVYGTNPMTPTRSVDKGASTPANLPVGRNPMGGPRGPMGKPMGGMGGPRGAMPAPQVLPTRTGIGQTGGQRPPQLPQTMKKGGMAASKRADGIAKRGKTRGKTR